MPQNSDSLKAAVLPLFSVQHLARVSIKNASETDVK
jgi:hypothetical protein